MKRIKNHIDELFKGIPRNNETEMVKQEIIENLEEKVFYLMDQGKEQEDAINKAIVEFGDIEDLKKELGVKVPAKKNMAKLNLEFSLWGSGLIIAFFIFIKHHKQFGQSIQYSLSFGGHCPCTLYGHVRDGVNKYEEFY